MAWSGSRPEKALRLATTFFAHPLVVSAALPGEARQWYQWHWGHQRPHFAVDERWDESLHKLLGAPWPCPERQGLEAVLADIATMLAARGWGFGRDSYAWYADADRSLCRAAWCVAVHTRPEIVIETGVAHGVTSRVLLEALKLNQSGHLWSIDLPFPFDHRLHGETGIVVTPECRRRWSYLEGTSRRRLPSLIASAGPVGLFVHDSLHTAQNTLFEMEQVAKAMSVGGAMLVDDIDSHRGFNAFAARHPDYETIVCPSADRQGLFGIAVRRPSA
jgi:hypothetical protein